MSRPSSGPPRYALCIVHYRDPKAVARVVAESATWTAPPSLIVIVDNSQDLPPVRSWVASDTQSHVEVIDPRENVGYGAAANLGLGRADEVGLSCMLMVTQDAKLAKETAQALYDVVTGDERAALCAPLLAFASRPETVFSAGGLLSRRFQPLHALHGKPVGPVKGDGIHNVKWADGACLMLDVRKTLAVGGVPAEYFLYVEDLDLAHRLQRAGYRTVINTSAIAYQEPGNFTPYLEARNTIYFLGKYSEDFGRSSRPIASVAILYSTIRGRRPAAMAWCIRGLWDGYLRRLGQPPTSFLGLPIRISSQAHNVPDHL